jgi:hypothetical protein
VAHQRVLAADGGVARPTVADSIRAQLAGVHRYSREQSRNTQKKFHFAFSC